MITLEPIVKQGKIGKNQNHVQTSMIKINSTKFEMNYTQMANIVKTSNPNFDHIEIISF